METLAFFLSHPTAEIHASGLVRRLGLAKGSVLGSLGLLKRVGVVRPKPVGHAVFYSLNRSDPVVKELKRLLTVSELKRTLEENKVSGVEVYLFGSAARGEDTEKSDIDLLVLGGREKRRDRALLNALGGPKVKVNFFTPVEFAMLSRKDRAFYDSMERDKVRLL